MGEELKNFYQTDVTCISNEFFRKYLSDVNPDYLRVYLYILWQKDTNPTITQIADELILTENDVEKALKFWKKQKMAISTKIPQNKIQEVKEDLTQKKEFKELLFFAEKMLPQTISPKQKESFEYMINDLRLPYDVVEYLIEYCCELDKTNARYMCAVANDWADRGITSLEQAKQLQKDFEKNKIEKVNSKSKKKNNFTERQESYKKLEEKNSKDGTFGW